MAATDYYPFGYEMLSAVVTGKLFAKSRPVAGPGRKYNFGDYRYGFSIPVWGEGALNWNQENDSDGEFLRPP